MPLAFPLFSTFSIACNIYDKWTQKLTKHLVHQIAFNIKHIFLILLVFLTNGLVGRDEKEMNQRAGRDEKEMSRGPFVFVYCPLQIRI